MPRRNNRKDVTTKTTRRKDRPFAELESILCSKKSCKKKFKKEAL